MTKLLYIKASPRPESRSVAVADAYLAALKAKMPGLSVDVMALWDETLPEFDGDRANAKLAVITGQQHSAIQKTKWDGVIAIVERFKAADIYLFAVPMWNGGIPYRLKQYIDIVHQPGHLWGLAPRPAISGCSRTRRRFSPIPAGPMVPPRLPRLRDRSSLDISARLAQSGWRHRHRRNPLPAHAARS
jgi:FMN-dependent NADH-azoreductase